MDCTTLLRLFCYSFTVSRLMKMKKVNYVALFVYYPLFTTAVYWAKISDIFFRIHFVSEYKFRNATLMHGNYF